MISNSEKLRYILYLIKKLKNDSSLANELRDCIYNQNYKDITNQEFDKISSNLNRLYGDKYPDIISFLRDEKIDILIDSI